MVTNDESNSIGTIEIYGIKDNITQDGENASKIRFKVDASQIKAIQKLMEISDRKLLSIKIEIVEPESLFQPSEAIPNREPESYPGWAQEVANDELAERNS